MVFVNRYTKNDAVNIFDIKEFENEAETFTLAVGQTDGRGLITKIADNGDIIWERIYSGGQSELVFEQVAELTPKSANDTPGFQYVVFARDAQRSYLISINSANGNIYWQHELSWVSVPENVQIIESKVSYDIFAIFSKMGKNPTVFRFSGGGQLQIERALELPTPDVLINGVDYLDGELVLVGHLISGGSELGFLLVLENSAKIRKALILQSIKGRLNDVRIRDEKYLVTGLSHIESAIFTLEFNDSGTWAYFEFPSSNDINSKLSLAQSGFYLLQNTLSHGIVNFLNFNFSPLWTKEIRVNGADNEIRKINYKISTDDITTFAVSDSGESLAIQTTSSFNTCATNQLKPPKLNRKQVQVIPFNVNELNGSLSLNSVSFNITTLNSTVVQICPPLLPDYSEEINITSLTSLQSPNFYIQAAGSDGSDSTAGLHARWIFRGALGEKHLPKGNSASNASNFNKPNDFVTIYRAKYRPFKKELDLFSSPSVVDDTNRVWVYEVDDVSIYVYFRNTAKYDQVRSQVNPLSQTGGFYTNYDDNIIEIEIHDELFFKVQLSVDNVLQGASLQTETLSVNDNSTMSVKALSARKTFNNPTSQELSLLCENGKTVRFRAISCNVNVLYFETYRHFIEGINLDQDWMNLGDFALTDQDSEAFSRLEPQPNSVHGVWKRFNDDAYVNTNNYQDRFSGSVSPDERNLKDVIQTYIQLSDSVDNPTAVEEIPLDTTEGTFVEVSNLDLLRIGSVDFHIARMMGLGLIDLHEDVYIESHVYVAEYTTFGDLENGNGASEVHHLAMSLPTSTDDARLPIPVELDYILPGVYYPGEDNPSEITDNDGYTYDGLFRYITIYMKAFAENQLSPPFYLNTNSVDLSKITTSVFGGLEHKLETELEWRKPEISNEPDYQNATTGSGPANNETVPLVLPDQDLIYHIHRQEEEGTHEYLGYGINWFSRSKLGNDVVSIETIIQSLKPLIPPSNCFAHLIREESPLLFTSSSEQARYDTNPNYDPGDEENSDRTIIRITYDFHSFHDKVDHPLPLDHPATDSELVDPVNANNPLILFPDDQENFADKVEIFFRETPPSTVSGQITQIADHPSEINLAIVTTGPYYMASIDETVSPEIPPNEIQNYIGGSIVIGSQINIIKEILVNGTNVEFTIYKKYDGHTILDSEIPEASEDLFESPDIFGDGYFLVIENMQEIDNWSTPNPHPTVVNIGTNWGVHRELLKTVDSEGNEQRVIEKTRGIWSETVLVEEIMEPQAVLDQNGNPQFDQNGDVITQQVHSGLYKFTFTNFQLSQHSQFDDNGPSVEWHGGVIRIHTNLSFANGEAKKTRKILKVDKIENIVNPGDTPTDLVVYATDNSFSDSSDYDSILIGTNVSVNFYPGYKLYLYRDDSFGLNESSTLPQGDEDKIVSFGLRTYDPDNSLYSKMSTPFLMVAQKIVGAEQPQLPDGPLFATRPDFFGRATYTFSTEYNHTPYGVLAFRANEQMFLNALYKKQTILEIRSSLEALGGSDEEFFTTRWQNFIDWAALEGADYETYPPDSEPENSYKFPNPDKQEFFDWANSVLEELGLPLITDPPGSISVGDSRIFNFVKGAIFSCMVPLTEIPIVYSRIKGSEYKPINKPQTIRDQNGNTLSPSSSAYDIAPMMKKLSTSPPVTQFTDFTLDGSSKNFYFYAMREMSSQMKLGEFSPIWGPIQLVNSFPAEAPEIVRIRPILPNSNLNIQPAIELEINAYDKTQNIEEIKIFRAYTKLDAQSVRSMEEMPSHSIIDQIGNNSWIVRDEFHDLDQIPFGDPLFYRVAVNRRIKYADTDGTTIIDDIAPSKPSKISASVMVETQKPESPLLKYASEPLSSAGILNNVILFWDTTCYNGTYFLFKRTAQGNWQKIFQIQSKLETVYVPLIDTDLATDQLATEGPDKNPLFHHFKVEVENTAGLRSTGERVRTVYIPDEWIDEDTLPSF